MTRIIEMFGEAGAKIYIWVREVAARLYIWLNRATVFLVIGFVIFRLFEVIYQSADPRNYFACKPDKIYDGLQYTRIMGGKKDEIKLLRLPESYPAIVIDLQPELSQQLATHNAQRVLNDSQNSSTNPYLANWLNNGPVARRGVFQSSSTNEEFLIERRWDPILKRNNLAQWDGERINEVLLNRSSLLFTETERGLDLNDRTPVSQGRCVRVPRKLFELEFERQEYDSKFAELNALRDAVYSKF